MGRENEFSKNSITPKGDRLFKGISLAALSSCIGILFQVDARIQKSIDARLELIKPTSDYIRTICKEVVDVEKERAREREQELRNSIDFIMRYYKR